MAWAILSGFPVEEIWPDYPAMNRLQAVLTDERDTAGEGGAGRTDPRVAVATATAMLLGWMVFRPFLERGGDLTDLAGFDEDVALDDAVQALLDRAR